MTTPLPNPRFNFNWAVDITAALRKHMAIALTKTEPQGYIMLSAPNGSVYKVAVDNAGTLVTSVVSSTDPPPPT